MKASTQSGTHTYYLNWEVQQAARKIIRDIMLVKPGETVLITSDTTSDERVVQATAGAALEAGAYPIVMQFPASLEQAIMIEPKPPVLEAIKAADVWIEYDYQLFYTRGWKQAMDAGTRQLTAAAMDVDMLINVIGRTNHPKIIELGNRICELTNMAQKMRITSPAGTDLTCLCEGRKCLQSGTVADRKGISVMLGGQTSMCPIEETINGTLVFDGGLFPPQEIGIMKNKIVLTVEKGVVTKIEGEGREAHLFKKWMAGWNDEKMYWIAHISCGFNPGVPEPTGRIEEDERIFGCVEVGIGTQGEGLGGKSWVAANHTDGMVLNPSIYLDDVAIEENGFYVEPGLVKLCKEMKVAGY
jgi:Leucyl aminopeptidase (aminopeptidase T)